MTIEKNALSRVTMAAVIALLAAPVLGQDATGQSTAGQSTTGMTGQDPAMTGQAGQQPMMNRSGMMGQPGQPMSGGSSMMGQDAGAMMPGERMAMTQARFYEVGQMLEAASQGTGATAMSQDEINQLRQEYTNLAMELDAMAAQGIQPQAPAIAVRTFVPGSLTDEPARADVPGDIDIFTDAQGNRYVLLDRQGRAVRSAGDMQAMSETMYDPQRYSVYEDTQGQRYLRIDQASRPVPRGDGGVMSTRSSTMQQGAPMPGTAPMTQTAPMTSN